MTAAARVETETGPASGHVTVDRASKRFGNAAVLSELSLSVARGEFVSLLGPSGCGKTTLLRIIAGLLAPDTGSIAIAGRELTRVAAHKRNIGVVFQSYALFPHLTVAENVAFGLQARRIPKAEVANRVAEALSLVRMVEFAGRGVTSLSGGQQQRIAVARSIVVKPALLLLDEPFSALDRKLRETMQIDLRRLLRDLGITSIFVTHDQDEALVMRTGDERGLREHPASRPRSTAGRRACSCSNSSDVDAAARGFVRHLRLDGRGRAHRWRSISAPESCCKEPAGDRDQQCRVTRRRIRPDASPIRGARHTMVTRRPALAVRSRVPQRMPHQGGQTSAGRRVGVFAICPLPPLPQGGESTHPSPPLQRRQLAHDHPAPLLAAPASLHIDVFSFSAQLLLTRSL